MEMVRELRLFALVIFVLSGCWGSAAAQDMSTVSGITIEEPVAPESDATAARIVDLHLKARGGEDKLRAIQAYRLKGHVSEGIREYEVTHYFRAPAKYRRETFREELGWKYLTVFATDGEHVWRQEIKPELKPAWIVEEDAKDEALPESFLLDQLIDWKEKGHHLIYAGKATIAGVPTYIVKAELNGGPKVYYYFDQKHFLIRNIGRQVMIAGKLVDVDHFPLRWQMVDGVRFEAAYELRNRGELLRRVEYKSIEVDPVLDEEIFKLPQYRELWLRQTGQGSSRLERSALPGGEDSGSGRE